MAIVVVGNEKGGCGKTTVAVNIAAMAAAAGQATLLIDADPGQQSAVKWWTRRQDTAGLAEIGLAVMNAKDLDSLPNLSQTYATVVIDTGAMDSPSLRAAMAAADLLVIPVQPDELDLWTLPTMDRLYTTARTMNAALQALVVLNRMPFQAAARLVGDAQGWIANNVPGLQDVPVVPLVGRAAYGRASGAGMAVTEPRPRDSKAAHEIEQLFLEVSKHGTAAGPVRARGSVPRRTRG